MKSFLIILCSALLLFSCKKESLLTSKDAYVFINADTLSFETVFTGSGSITQSFKIFNPNNQKLKISQIQLSGRQQSPFKININGRIATELNDIIINANDSMYVFVQVNINASSDPLPFVVNDSILITYNENTSKVFLQAFGQNAVYLKNEKITGNVVWNNTLPYVILGSLQVDTNAVLQITEGARIYVHGGAPFLVDGTLIANGTKEAPVIFTGDRMDTEYKNLPGSWPGLHFRNSSVNNSLRQTVIKNATTGILTEQLPSNSQPKLRLSQCIIDNNFEAGIVGINTHIVVDNCLITNCGSNIVLSGGGTYSFTNCTVAAFNNNFINHSNPVLQLSNSSFQNGNNTTNSLEAIFTNCIFWGDPSVDNEIAIDQEGSLPFSVVFDHVLYRAKGDINKASFISSIVNKDPLFDTINIFRNSYNFHISNPSSPVINAGITTLFPLDLDDKLRDATPYIGCYEN